MLELLVELVQVMSVVVVVAYVLCHTRLFRDLLARRADRRRQVVAGLLFGLLSMGGAFFGYQDEDLYVDAATTVVVIAGLLGGPWVGLIAGALGGTFRLAAGLATETVGLPSALVSIVGGVLGGYLSRHARGNSPSIRLGLAAGALVGLIQFGLLLPYTYPYTPAGDLLLGALMLVGVTAGGVGIFISIVRTVQAGEERIRAQQSETVLRVARDTLSHLRQGLDEDSAGRVADIILQRAAVAAVQLTDGQKILAHRGEGQACHPAGQPVDEAAQGAVGVVAHRCGAKGCPLRQAVAAPLITSGGRVGGLHLYPRRERAAPSDVELARGLSQLLSLQVELAEVETQRRLLAQARLRYLQAQINPHFLFNALGAIVSFCRTDGEKARDLLLGLSDFFRLVLQEEEFTTLERELEHVRAYLALEQARFGARLNAVEEVDETLLGVQAPVLILQPLVENALRHGLDPQAEGGTLRIVVERRGSAGEITIADDGVGLNARRLEEVRRGEAGIGLRNVDERLRGLYGPEYGLWIESQPGQGTTVRLRIPAAGEATK